jgi:hypothetical protein
VQLARPARAARVDAVGARKHADLVVQRGAEGLAQVDKLLLLWWWWWWWWWWCSGRVLF